MKKVNPVAVVIAVFFFVFAVLFAVASGAAMMLSGTIRGLPLFFLLPLGGLFGHRRRRRGRW